MGRRPHPRFALQGRSIRHTPTSLSPFFTPVVVVAIPLKLPFPPCLPTNPCTLSAPRNTNLRNNASFVVCVCACVRAFSFFSECPAEQAISNYTQFRSVVLPQSLSARCVVQARDFFKHYFFMKDMLNEHGKKKRKSRNKSPVSGISNRQDLYQPPAAIHEIKTNLETHDAPSKEAANNHIAQKHSKSASERKRKKKYTT